MSSAAIVPGIGWTREGLSTVQTRKIEDNVYVVNLLSVGQRGGGKAYMAPGATTVIKLAPPGGAGYIDGGEYHLDIAVGGETECIEGLKVFGADAKDCLENGCDKKKLDILSKPYLEVKIANSDKCMGGISMSIKVSPNYAGLSPLYYDVGLYPVKVKFDRLVATLTCHDFNLKKLKEDVKRSVLAAALGSDDPCASRNNIGGVKEQGEEQTASKAVGDYYWTVIGNTFYAKRDGAPTTTDYDFYIRFEGTEPAVWVESVPDDAAAVAQEVVSKNTYDSYVLRVAIGDKDIGEYGQSAKMKAIANYAFSRQAITTYALTCSTVSGICEAATSGPLGIAKASLYNIPGCVLAGALSGWTLRASTLNGEPDYTRTVLFGLPGTTFGEILQFRRAKSGFYSEKLGIGTTLGKVKYIANIKKESSWEKLEEILETLKKSPSGLGGVDYADTTIGQILGVDKDSLKNLADALKKANMKDEAEKVNKLADMLSKKVRDVNPETVAKQYKEVLEIKSNYEKAIEEAKVAIKQYNVEIEKLEKELERADDASKAKIQKQIEDLETLRLAKEDELVRMENVQAQADGVIKKLDDAMNKGDELTKRIFGDLRGRLKELGKSFLCGPFGSAIGAATTYGLFVQNLNSAIPVLGIGIPKMQNNAVVEITTYTNTGLLGLRGRDLFIIKLGNPDYYIGVVTIGSGAS